MIKNLILDAFFHLRECIVLSASIFVAVLSGLIFLKLIKEPSVPNDKIAGEGKEPSGVKVPSAFRIVLIMILTGLVLLICPVTATAIRLVTGVYYDSQDIWNIIPIIPFGAFMCAMLVGELKERKDTLCKGTALIVSLILAGAVLVCGSLGKTYNGNAACPEDITDSEKQIAEFVCDKYSGAGNSVVFASDEITAYIHVYSGKTGTLYGRDMWDGRLTKNRFGTYTNDVRQLHDDMRKVLGGENELAADLCRRAFDHGATICIMPVSCRESIDEAFTGGEYTVEEFVTSYDTEYLIILRG